MFACKHRLAGCCRPCSVDARWLRSAFSELAWEIHHAIQEDDLVVVHATMSGQQTGPFVAYGRDGEVAAVFPPWGHRFETTQSHWFRMREGKVAEHWANRDELGMGQQLGWTPPSPLCIVPCCWLDAG